IRRDLGARTAYSKYIASAGLQDGLFGICKAYALYDEPVGYAQGMNFIAMPLLFNMPEEEAFTLFVRLMSKYNLRSLFTAEMTGLHMHLYLFERLLEDYEPALYCHLHRRGVPPNLYATQWFLTLFAYRFPLQLVLRVYDLVLSEGLGAILKFGIALMQRNAQTLLGMKDMVQLSTHLKERLFDVYIDRSPSASSILESGFFGSTSGTDKEVYRADELVRDACAVVITPETLAAYTSEFEEKARAEKDREIELESLRNENANLSTRVRKLELRTQQSDAEHVDLASSLVRTKVENDSLLDENESLKMQVEELRKMVDKQPQEVEDRLKAEMDQIMARNIEVQDRNRGLEEQVHEMEQELVGTKMMYAQLNAEHDALKQKLRDIQNMLASTDEQK
ncbi:RabGAP/TBC, partial [Aureobasidium melanogenum]